MKIYDILGVQEGQVFSYEGKFNKFIKGGEIYSFCKKQWMV